MLVEILREVYVFIFFYPGVALIYRQYTRIEGNVNVFRALVTIDWVFLREIRVFSDGARGEIRIRECLLRHVFV